MIVTLLNLKKRIGNEKQKDIVKKLTVNDFEKAFNSLGYEIEETKRFSNLKGLKFAKIIEVYKNPNSENLNVCKVQIDTNKFLTIQTVAKNPKVGHMTIIFPAGAEKDGQVFQNRELKGIVSEGMFSGLSELGYDNKYLNLSNNDDIFMFTLYKSQNEEELYKLDPIEYFELDDYIFDISVAANRNDANSYYVICKELAAYFNLDFIWKYDANNKIKKSFNTKIKVQEFEPDLAKHLSYLEIKNPHHNLEKSDYILPSKYRTLLAKHNIKVSNDYATDLANLCLLMTGVPIITYDKNLFGNEVKPILYSGKINLSNQKVVDVHNVLALQNENNEIVSLPQVTNCNKTLANKNKASSIVFELGIFNGTLIRSGAIQTDLLNNFSIQGARTINYEMLRIAYWYLMHKFNELKLKVSNLVNQFIVKKGKIISQNKRKLKLYINSKNSKISPKEILYIDNNKLKKIGFTINKNRFIAPAYRNDINNFEDIIEEYCRFYGYDNIKEDQCIFAPYKINKRDNRKTLLKAQGYTEIRTYSLVSMEKNYLNPFNFENTIKLMTFVSKEREVIRNSIITSMLEVAIYHNKQKINNFSFFEEGMINNNQKVFGLISSIKTFEQIKQDIINILALENLEFIPFVNNEFIHKNVSAKIMLNNKMIGWIGKIHPKLQTPDCFVAEFFKLPIENENQKLISKVINYEPLKSIDLTFQLNINQHLEEKINEIKSLISVFEISYIDSFIKENQNYATIRIVADSDSIEILNKKYNG